MCSFRRQAETERSAPLLTQKAGETFIISQEFY